jgi:hypothetical protein
MNPFLMLWMWTAAVLTGDDIPVNYDESKMPPYTLPDPLVCADGTPVHDAKTWREKRRPELLRLFESEVYGKTLLGRPKEMKFVVREEKKDARGGAATRLRVGALFEGRDDGRQMELLVYLPNGATGPAPAFLGLNFDGNYSTTDEADIPLPTHWVAGVGRGKSSGHKPLSSGRGSWTQQWQYDLALSRGYAVITAGYGEIEPDADGNATKGVRGLGPTPGPNDWGAIGGWAWALSRAMDYIETNPRIDAKRVAVTGFSRLGKTSLWAGAQDERFAAVVSIDSGAGGAALSRRIFGETVAHLTTRFPHWFCSQYAKYAGKEHLCPVDQHELIALVAPRPVLIISATEDLWADPKGEFLGGVGADPVYRLLSGEGIGQKEWPGPAALVNSRIGYYLRRGKHDVTPDDWKACIEFADRWLGK